MGKVSTQKKFEEFTFDELVELALHRIHSALLEGGGKEMRTALHFWLGQAITWSKEKKK